MTKCKRYKAEPLKAPQTGVIMNKKLVFVMLTLGLFSTNAMAGGGMSGGGGPEHGGGRHLVLPSLMIADQGGGHGGMSGGGGPEHGGRKMSAPVLS